METSRDEDTMDLDLPDEADRAKAAAVDALKARLEVEEQAARSKLRADEALEAQRAAQEAAERARAEAEEAEQARRAADEEAEQARVAAEQALQTWREKLAQALEAEVGGEEEEAAPPATESELPAALEVQVANLTDVPAVADPDPLAASARHRTCVVSYRREFRKVTFYARAFDNEGNELVVAESQPFRARGNGAPDPTEQAIDALEGLNSQLLGDGWEVAGFGDAWFERMFRRRVGAAVG
jgi:uncharacterized membrane protein YqiK